MNKRMLFHRIMSIVMTFVMVLSSLFSTGFLTGITVYAADGDRELKNVVKNQNLGWNLSNDSDVQTGNADQPIYPYEDIYTLITEQVRTGTVTIDYTGLNRIDNDHGSGNKQKIWEWLRDIYKDSDEEWNTLSSKGVYGAVLEKDKTYSVKYKGVQLKNGQKVTVEFKVTNCSLKPSWNVDTSGAAPHDDDGPYIVFFGNKPGSCRWTGWTKVKCQVSIHDVGNDGALSSPVVGSFSFMDIDQSQAIQIDAGSTPMIMGGKVGENLKVANNDDAYKKHINQHMNGDAKYTFFCNNTNNASDQKTNKKYRLQTDLKFDNANHDFTYWFYAGHQEGSSATCPGDNNCQEANQKYGIFMSFEGGAFVDMPAPIVNAPSVTKKVNGVDNYYLKNGGEEFTYTLQSTIDPTVHTATTISQFGWEDTIQNELQYTGAWSVTCNGTDVTGQFSASFNGQHLSVYKSNPADASGTYVLSFKCKIREGADLSRFVQPTGYAMIPNSGEVHFTSTSTNSPVQQSNTVYIYYKPPVRPTPTKAVDKTTLNTADDSWQYTVSQQIPAQTWLFGPMDRFVITDQIDTCLAVDEVKIFSGTKDVTNQFSVSTNGNLVTATASAGFLNNTADLTGNHAGTTISMRVKVHIAKKLKDIKQHHPRLTSGDNAAAHLNGTETILTEQNNAQVAIQWDAWKDGWNETKTTNTVTTTVGVPHIQAPTKTVSDNNETNVAANTLTNADEHWTYTITQQIPPKTAWAYRYESFSINDEIDSCLTIDRDKIEVLVDGKDQKSNGNFVVSVDDNNKVTVTPTANVLDGDRSAVIYGENLSGTTIQVKIPVYIDSKGNEGGSDASNQTVLEMIRAHGHFHTNEDGTEDYMTFQNLAYTLVDDMIDEQNTPTRMETGRTTTTVNCPQIADPEKFVSDKDDLNWDYSVEKGGEDKLLDKNRISDSVNEWTYTIRQDIPEHTAPLYFYKSFVIDDAVDPCLEYDANNVVVTIGDQEYGRDYFTVEKREDNTLVVTATDAALKDKAFYGDKAGSRIKIRFPVHIKIADPVYDTSGLKGHGHLKEDSAKGDNLYEFLNGDDNTITKSTIDNLLKVKNNIDGNTTLPDVRRTNSVTTQVEVSEPKIKKKADRFEWEIGEDVKYSLTVTDKNPYAIMDKVTVTDNDLPDSLQLDSSREDSIIVYASGATENYSAPDNSTSITDPRGTLTEIMTEESGTAQYSDITSECEVTYYNDQGTTGDGFTIVIPKQYRGEIVTITFLCKATENWDNCSYPDTCTNGSVVENTASVYSTLMLEDEPLNSTERVWINTPHLNIQKYTGEWNYVDGEFQQVDKDENQTNYHVGDKVHYTVLVKNSHPGTIARDPVVTDELLNDGLSIDENSIEVHKVRLDENGDPMEKYGETATTRLIYGTDYQMTNYGGKAFEIYFTGRTLRHWGATPFLTAEQYETAGLLVDDVNNGKYETGAEDDTKVPGLKRTDEAKYNSERKDGNGDTIIYREDKAFENGSILSSDSAWLTNGQYANTWKSYPVGYQEANLSGQDTSDVWESRRTVNHQEEWDTSDTAYIISYDATVTRGISLDGTARNETYADSENSDYVKSTTLISFEGARLQIDKECDKGFGGEYTVGSTGHYSLVVTQTREQVEAKNVVIKDSLDKEEALIKDGSVKVYYYADKSKVSFDENRQAIGGEDITSACTFPDESNTEHGIYIQTNRNLTSSEAIVVTYDVDFSDSALAGQNVPNVAMTKADNAYPELDEYTGFTYATDSISVRKTSDVYSGTTVKQGDTITYTIEVRNTTGDDLHNILVKDQIPELSTYVDGSVSVKDSGGIAKEEDGSIYAILPTLHANQTKQVVFAVTVNEEATEDDVIYNTAEVYDATDEQISPDMVFEDADDFSDTIMGYFESEAFVMTNQTAHPLAYWAVDDNIVHIIAEDVTVQKESDKKTYYVGEDIYYTVTLKNNAVDVPLEDLKLDDVMDSNESAQIDENSFRVTLTSDGETKELSVTPVLNETKTGYHIDFGIDLHYSEQVTVTYIAKAVKAIDSLTNTADFTDSREKHYVVDNEVIIDDPALRINKTVDPTLLQVNQEAQYEVVVNEPTDRGEITNVTVEDALEASGLIEIQEDSIRVSWNSEDITESCTITVNEALDGYKVETGRTMTTADELRIQYTGIATLDAVSFCENTEDGTIDNTASAYGDGTGTVYDTAEVTVTDAALRIDKSVNPGVLQVGQDAEYKVVVNTPNDQAQIHNLTIEDALEEAGLISIKEDTVQVFWNGEDITDSCTVTVNEEKDGYKVETGRTMTVNDTCTILYTGTATKEAPAFCESSEDGYIDNTAAAYGDETEKVMDTAKVTVTEPVLRVDKTVDPTVLQVGEEAAYEVIVNTPEDNVQIENVSVNDILEEAGLILIKDDSIAVYWNNEDITSSCTITVNEDKDGYTVETGRTMTAADELRIRYTGIATVNAPEFCEETADGTIDNTVTAYGDGTDPVSDVAEVEVSSPILRIDKSVDPNVLQVGEDGSYEVVVNTPADNVTIDNIVVEDTLEESGLIEIQGDSIEVFWNNEDITDSCTITVNETLDGYKVETGRTMTSADELRIRYTGTATEDGAAFCDETADGTIDNTATAYGDGTDPVSDIAKVKVTNSVLRMDKTVSPSVLQIGDEAKYEVTVNTPADNVKINNIVIEDMLEEAGLIEIQESSIKVLWNNEDITGSCTITVNETLDGYKVETGRTMTAADECKILYSGIATEAAPAFCVETEDGYIDNTATAYGAGTDPISDMAQVKVVDPENGLYIEKDSDRDVYNVTYPEMLENGTEDIAHYTVKVTNTKDGVARNVVITDQFEKTGMSIDADSIKVEKFDAHEQTTTDITDEILGKDADNITVTDSLNGYTIRTQDDLSLSDAFIVTYDVIFTDPMLAGSDILNHAVATDDNGDEVETDHTVEVKVPDLVTTKTSDKDKYYVGENGHYTVTVSNDETDSIAYNIRIHDELLFEEGTEPKIVADTIKVTGPDGSDITSAVKITATDTSYDIETGLDLAYGEKITVTYDVDFSDINLAGQQVPNTVTAVADNASAEADNLTNIPRDGIQAVKSSDPENGSTVNTGDTITYSITLTNTEDTTINNVMVRDSIPDLTEYVSGGELMKINGKDHVTFLIDSIAPGESETVSFVVRVTGTGYAVIENIAQFKVAGEEDPSSHWEDPDFYDTNKVVHYIPYTVDIDNAKLDIEKYSDKEVYQVGETGHYTVRVTETKEDSIARNVVIKDALQIDGAKILPETIRITDTEGNDLTRLVADIQADETSYHITTGMDLAYNEFFTVTYDVLFESQTLANQTVINIAKAKADNAEAETNNDVDVPYTEIGDGLEALKSSDPVSGTKVKNGDTITYNITVRNTSEETKENILVLDAVPMWTEYVTGSARIAGDSLLDQIAGLISSLLGEIPGFREAQGNDDHLVTIDGKEYVSFTIDSLAAGEEATVSFDVIVSDDATEEDTIRNVALVKPADNEDPDSPETWDPDTFVPTNETEHPLGPWVETDDIVKVIAPTLSIEKSSDKDVYIVGETGHYKVVVTQTKEGCTARNLVIKDAMQVDGVKVLPDTIRLLDPEGKDITEAVKITTTDTSYQIDTGMDLAYNESFTVTYDVTFVEESLAGQQVVNVAKAKADNAQAETENDVTPAIVEEGLEAVKSADPASGTVVKAGDTITYDITVTNAGAEDKENVLILDEVPALTAYVEGSGGSLVTIGEKAYVSFVVPTLASGASETVSFSVTVSEEATEEDVIENTALVKVADEEDPSKPETWNPDGFVSTNTTKHPLGPWVVTDHTVNVEQPGSPRLLVTKASDKDSYNIGETGKYTITVTNDQADTTAENVVINDVFETTGMMINQDSIKVTGTDGNTITPASITMNGSGNGFTIATGASLAGGQSMTVTYQVVFEDTALAGTDVTNHVSAASDNTSPANADNTVKIAKQETQEDTEKPDKKDRTKTPDKTTGGSNKGSGSVQTSDILIGVLIVAAVTLAVTGGMYYRRKKRSVVDDYFWRK